MPIEIPPHYLDRFTAIRDRKHLETRAALVAIHELIVLRYELLDLAIRTETIASMSSDQNSLASSALLRSCYGGSTSALKDLKDDIKRTQPRRLLKYCPMCGITLPSTFDHYLPAIAFPEFSVHPMNLVPCCSGCNTRKNDDWLNLEGARQYLHSYTDTLPDTPFLQAHLHQLPAFQGVGVTFELAHPANFPLDKWTLIESHFRRLDLLGRYNEEGNVEVEELLANCRAHIAAGGPAADPMTFLINRAEDEASTRGHSHWRAVLMLALANHPRFQELIALA